ncbi:MAG: hypothetical protein HY912_00355 [Desulfomonile tiedjei]|uniref:Uncharacterized protein n=1 Tax=Desulfomonile tiedjei TaxID=2358 RepID=A0A9D6YYN8_9BACT|nr:hypothetical protein [Desulfomonile tiedjei]
MPKLVLITMVLISFVAVAEVSATCTGYVNSLDEISLKIERLKDMIFLNYQKSGLVMWAPLYYWVTDGGNEIFYCYALLPLGQMDPILMDRVNKYCTDCGTEPVYIPIRINRGGIARS